MFKKTILTVAAMGLALPALAIDKPKNMTSSDCFACHAIKTKMVGPSFMAIAEKYKGDEKAPKALAKKIKEGGSGAWGAMPMTAHASLSDETIDDMVAWTLALAEDPKPKKKTVKKEKKVEKAFKRPGTDAEGYKKMQGSDCLACHKIKTKIVGPSFEMIAEKYENNEENIKAMVKKIKEGGSGAWGAMPMTPHASLKDKDAEAMADWILNQRDKAPEKKKEKKETKADKEEKKAKD